MDLHDRLSALGVDVIEVRTVSFDSGSRVGVAVKWNACGETRRIAVRGPDYSVAAKEVLSHFERRA